MGIAYERSAEVYDLFYGWLDYEAHAATLRRIIDDHNPQVRSVLDVACGTGRYTEQLARWYHVEGLDISESMLAVARRRLPRVTLHVANMASFQLDRTYDALVCMFSSVAYLTSLKDLASMLRTCADHLNPGGVLVIEPWFPPSAWSEGHVAARVVEGDGVTVARVDTSVVEGTVATMCWAWSIASSDGRADAFVEEHRTGLFTTDEYATLLTAAGLSSEYDSVGPLKRGLHIATKP